MSINAEAKKQYEANRQNVAGRQTDEGDRRPGRGHILGRLVKTLFSFYPKLLPIVAVCILVQAILSAMPAIFIQRALEIVGATWESGDWNSVSGQVTTLSLTLVGVYAILLGTAASAVITMLLNLRLIGKKSKEKVCFAKHTCLSALSILPAVLFGTFLRGALGAVLPAAAACVLCGIVLLAAEALFLAALGLARPQWLKMLVRRS